MKNKIRAIFLMAIEIIIPLVFVAIFLFACSGKQKEVNTSTDLTTKTVETDNADNADIVKTVRERVKICEMSILSMLTQIQTTYQTTMMITTQTTMTAIQTTTPMTSFTTLIDTTDTTLNTSEHYNYIETQIESKTIDLENFETEIITEPTIAETETKTYLGNLRITGYVATGNPTALGEMPYVGGVALNQSYGLAYGTRIYIEGFGEYIVNDTGCAYGVVDVFCNTVEECYALTSYADVYIMN